MVQKSNTSIARITEFKLDARMCSYSSSDKRAWQKCHFVISTIGHVCATKWQKCVNDSRVSLNRKKREERATRSPSLVRYFESLSLIV